MYSRTKVRLRRSASIRAHLWGAATRGAEVSSWLAAHRLTAPRLCKDGAPPAHPTAGALALRRPLGLDSADALAQLREYVGFGPEDRRNRAPQLHRVRHRAVGAKEVQRARCTQGPSGQQGGEPVDAGPVVDPVDQVVLHRIGRGVDQLVHHRVAVDQLHHADLLRRPEVFPAPPERILAACEYLMKILEDHGVVVLLTAHGSNTSISHRCAASIRQ
jgi:hypothetical protein